jgi:hypothetical protein
MISQLKEITDAGFEKDTNVLVYFDPNCNGRNARIFDVNAVRKEEAPKKVKKTIIGDGRDPFVRDIAEDCHIPGLPQIPAAITLRYFLEYARSYYPAKNYLLFLMGHGVIVGNDTFLPDPDDNSAITLADLGWILRTFAEKVREGEDEFHVVGFHSCSMSSVELAYELAGSARYMIGTQGAAFPGSWPYRQLLKKILHAIDKSKKPKRATKPNNGTQPKRIPIDDNELVDTILRGLQNLSFYNGEDFWLAGFSSDLSLCRLDINTVNKLRKPIEDLSRALKDGLALKDKDPSATNCIQLAHLESQSYWGEDYTDLYDFCSCLSKRCTGRTEVELAIKDACDSVTKALRGGSPDEQLVIYSDYYGPAYQFSNGLSIYFPWKSPRGTVMETYQTYKFTQEHEPHSWLSFLVEYFYSTQRDAKQTRNPRRSAPEVVNSMRWRYDDNLLKVLSDQRLLSLGPPPRKVGGDLSKVGGDLSKVGGDLSKVGGDLSKIGGDLSGKVGGDLSKVGGDLSKVGGDLSKVGGDLSEKVGGDLSKVGGDLSKILGSLSKIGGNLLKVGGNLSKVGGDLSGKVGGDLSKVGDNFSRVGGDLSKVGGDLAGNVAGGPSKAGANLSGKAGNLSKVGGDLSNLIGDLSKVGGDLSKVGGDLSSKVGGDLAATAGVNLAAKVGGDLAAKVGGDLSKVGGDLGGLYGHTVIKNFEAPEDKFVTSRSHKYFPTSTRNGSHANPDRKRRQAVKASKK